MRMSSESQAGYMRHERQESRIKCIFDRRAEITVFFIGTREICKMRLVARKYLDYHKVEQVVNKIYKLN